MGDQVLIKDRRSNVINSQKKRIIMPDVTLHTKNVMIPVAKPCSCRVPYKQSFDVSLSRNKPRILKEQSYKNNPALMFSTTLSHTLLNSLTNFFEVKRFSYRKSKDEDTRYPISGKTDSLSTRKTSILQNMSSLKRPLCKKKDTLHFPNTMLMRLVPLTNEKDLHKTSTKSIKLSRKCDLLQIKDQIKYEDTTAVLPKIETPVTSDISKSSIVSLSSRSSCNITDTVSTLSMLSVLSFKIDSKKTYADIANKRESVSEVASNRLHGNNSEYEINVLHYDNDIVSRDKFPHSTQSHLKFTNIHWSSNSSTLIRIQNSNVNLTNKKSATDNYRWNTDHNIKHMQKDDSVSFSQREKYNVREIKNIEENGIKAYDCKRKYSWQVIGTSAQTSYSLLQDLINNINTEDDKSTYKTCSIKYSWQIIGISTQASLHNYNDLDYWRGILLAPNKNYNQNDAQIGDNERNYVKSRNHAKYPEGRSKRYLIVNNQKTQTCTEKEVQTDTNNSYMEKILEGLIGRNDNCDELLDECMIKPLIPNISSTNSVISSNGNEKTKKEELLTRLMYTLNKLNRSEQKYLDKNWIEISPIDREETFEQEEISTQNVEENIEAIIQSAQEYITKLDSQLKDLDSADQQVENSMMKTLKDIDETFQSLLNDMCHEINKRREQLILEAMIHQHESLIPLRACRKEVEAQIKNAQNIVTMSENMLQHSQRDNANGFGKIIAASNNIGRIPAVPYSEELPNINFDRPLNSCKEEIIEQISKFGCISRTIPVQIMSIEERPAGLFVKWHITNPEYTTEEQTFVVEKAKGEILDPASNEFEMVYKGPETCCFVRNISVNQPITLRVRMQADNITRSVHHVAQTSIPPYSWEFDNKDYVITNNGKSAAKFTNTISTLFSHGPQFDANHIIEFKFLEVLQEGNNDEGIALVYNPQGSHDILKRTASLMITPQGKIFMDGDEKLMRLPKMRFGTNIMISAFRKNAHVLRINVESENKCVTYDWRVQTPLYFAARFTERKKWNLMVK